MLEPYQRGKIPVIFVHGLASDRFTWIQMINELRSVPWVNERCQIWTFQYATGQPFLASGAEMRQQLRDIAGTFDPQGTDRALRSTMLVGHSMGGLVSKLQVTYSGNILWEQIASKPFSEVNMQPQDRERIDRMFFFEPLPGVSRVVFIGTPHQGSFWAQNVWGRLGSSLVKMPTDRVQVVDTLVRNNPDVFAKLLRKGIPTSIDLLKPDSPLLIGMQQTPVNPSVKLHSIIGTGSPFSDGTPADGVVPVSSAGIRRGQRAPRRRRALRPSGPSRCDRGSRPRSRRASPDLRRGTASSPMIKRKAAERFTARVPRPRSSPRKKPGCGAWPVAFWRLAWSGGPAFEGTPALCGRAQAAAPPPVAAQTAGERPGETASPHSAEQEEVARRLRTSATSDPDAAIPNAAPGAARGSRPGT